MFKKSNKLLSIVLILSSSLFIDSSFAKSSCTMHNTHVVKELKDEICFSLYPITQCMKECHPLNIVKKKVSFHCLDNEGLSDKWKEKIKNGELIDLSKNEANLYLNIDIPMECVPNN